MIFTRKIISGILDGSVTEFRRPVRSQVCPWRIGSRLIVQKSQGSEPSCHIKPVWTYEAGLAETSDDDARRCGYGSLDAFLDYWRTEYRTGPITNPEIWVVRFELSKEDPPRYLTAGGVIAGKRGNYTSNMFQAVPDEPECVPKEWQEGHSKERRAAYDTEFGQAKADKARLARLREEFGRARREGKDVSDLVAQIDRVVEEMRERRAS